MAEYEVEAPDGSIHLIEGPEDATPQQIEDFASRTIGATPKMDLSATQSAGANFVNMVPFGADAFGAIAAATYGKDVDVPFGEKQAAAKALVENAAKEGFDQHKLASMVGAGAGILAPAALIPSSLYKGGSVAQRALKSGAVAGGYGMAYGAGQGNTADERITNSITSGAMAVPFGSGGSLVLDAGAAAGPYIAKGAKSLAERAARLFDKNRGTGSGRNTGGGQETLQYVKKALDQPVDTSLTPGSIPLTQGQLTQNPRQQALEYGAQAGVYGDDAQKMALEARDIQSEAAKVALGNPSDLASVESAQNIQNALKTAYKSAKAKTSSAYNAVGEATQDEPLKIAGSYVRETVFPQMKDWLRKGDNGIGFDLNAEGWGEAKRLYQQAETVGNADKLTAMNFSRLEFWRSKVTNRLAKTQDPAEKKFLGGLLERYDRSMKQLPREAIKSGDDAIVDMMEKARLARKEQGVLFEKSKLVKDIVQNDDLTAEQLANTVTSLGPKTGSYVRDILRTAKDETAKEGLRTELRTAILGNALNKSLSAEVRAGSNVQNVEKMVSFDKLATNLERLKKNQSLLKQIMPDEAQRKAFDETLRAVQLIKSTKPGTKNYSNSAYTLLNFIRTISPAVEKASVPLVGSLGGGMEKWGQGAATLELQKSLAPVLKGLSDEMTGPLTNIGKKYGRQVVTGGAQSLGISNSKFKVTPEESLYGPPPEVDLPETTAP